MTGFRARLDVRWAPLLGLVLVAALGGACVEADVDLVEAGTNEPMPTTSTVVEGEDTLPIGVATVTPRGNTIAVVDAQATPAGVHTLVEACASSEATDDVGVSLAFFLAQFSDGSTTGPIEPRDAREPALRTGPLLAGTCAVGWLSFDVDEEKQAAVRYLVFGSQSAATRWDLSEVR